MILKNKSAYKTIGEVAKQLNLISTKSGKIQTHTIRFWETQFKQIKPSIKAGRRRYYSEKDINVIKLIKFLLKEQGLTISGAKKILNKGKLNKLDVDRYFVVNNVSKDDILIKNKLEKITKIIKDLKKLNDG